MFEIAIGAISGVVASAFIFLLKILTQNYFIPLFQKISYKGTIIEGKWSATDTEKSENNVNNKISYSLQIHQNAYDIKGFLHITTERKRNVNFIVSGQYSEGYLQLICRAHDKGISSYASMLLKVVSAGKEMEGIIAFRNSYDDSVVHFEIKLIYES